MIVVALLVSGDLFHRRSVRPGVVRQISVHQPTAYKRYDAFRDTDIHFTWRQWAIEEDGCDERIGDGAGIGRNAIGHTSGYWLRFPIAVLFGQKIAGHSGPDPDAGATPKQVAILAMSEPTQKAVAARGARVSRPSRLRLPTDHKDQGQ